MKAYGTKYSKPHNGGRSFKVKGHPRDCKGCNPGPQGGGNKARARREGKAAAKA